MNSAAVLERRYRLILRAYPRHERHRLENELVAVLLACAPPGRRVPPLADVVNLLVHGLRARLRVRRTPAAAWLPGPSSAPEPETYGQALQTVWMTGFRPTLDDWGWRGMRRFIKPALLVLALVCAVTVTISTIWFLRFDTPFGPGVEDGYGATAQPGKTIWLGEGLTLSGSNPVSLDAATPRITRNTAGARVVVMRCTGHVAELLAQSGGEFQASGLCDTLARWSPGIVQPSIPHQRGVPIVIAVTLSRPGIVKIAGLDLSLHDGWRHGHQNAGYGWTVRSHA